jgi:hypothetical protein
MVDVLIILPVPRAREVKLDFRCRESTTPNEILLWNLIGEGALKSYE